jgi:hypothetical protein
MYSKESGGGCQEEYFFPFLIASHSPLSPLFLPLFTLLFHLNRFMACADFGGDKIGELLGVERGGAVNIHREQVDTEGAANVSL